MRPSASCGPCAGATRSATGVRTCRSSISRRAMAESVTGLPLRGRIDMKIDHADAALLEHVDAFCDRRPCFRGAGHRPDADGALCLGKLGDVGHRVFQPQPDPAVLDLAAAGPRDISLMQLVVEI